MRTKFALAAALLLLAGPGVIAFFSGGYFDQPRLIGAIAAWALVAIGVLVSPQALPSSRPARIALIGLAALTLLTGLSIAWAPLKVAALEDLQRLMLYLRAFSAPLMILRARAVRPPVDPLVALRGVVVGGDGRARRGRPGRLTIRR